jgi:ABC-type sulfate transport system permease component
VAGKICDITGSYEMAYAISAVMLLVAAVMAVMVRAPKSVDG